MLSLHLILFIFFGGIFITLVLRGWNRKLNEGVKLKSYERVGMFIDLLMVIVIFYGVWDMSSKDAIIQETSVNERRK